MRMRDKIKILFKWLVTFALCFIILYLIMLFGGWKFFESGDPILIELGIAYVSSIFVFVFFEVVIKLEKRITYLEERVCELEKSSNDVR